MWRGAFSPPFLSQMEGTVSLQGSEPCLAGSTPESATIAIGE